MTTLVQKNVKYIVIHYTATAFESDFSAADIDAMHKQRGWSGIGYHKCIRKSGLVEDGRPLRKRGAHVKGHNHHSVGICYEGGVYADDPDTGLDTRTDAQKESMERVIRDMLDRYPGAKVVGHRDMPDAATQCPGFDVAAWWAEVQRKRDTRHVGLWARIMALFRGITPALAAIALLTALIGSVAAHEDRFKARITDIYDGDTMTATIELGLGLGVSNQKLRLDCIDTPEVRGAERADGLAVRDIVRGWVQSGDVLLHIKGKGKFGRWIADVWPEGWQESISDRLRREGLGVVPSYAKGCD